MFYYSIFSLSLYFASSVCLKRLKSEVFEFFSYNFLEDKGGREKRGQKGSWETETTPGTTAADAEKLANNEENNDSISGTAAIIIITRRNSKKKNIYKGICKREN